MYRNPWLSVGLLHFSFFNQMWKMTRGLHPAARSGHLSLFVIRFCLCMLQKGLFFISIAAFFSSLLSAQESESGPMSCMNAQEILFPLYQNDFSKSEVLMNESTINALYYLYEDRYTFWYKFIATQDIEINFSVSPSNDRDRYRSIMFKYGGPDFCDKLVNQNLQPQRVKRSPIFTKSGEILYKNTIEASKGDTFFISVLSLNAEDCGHYLYVESGEEKFSFHAIHRPCYNITRLEQPDFSTSKEEQFDVSLSLDMGSDESEREMNVHDSLPEPGFSALQTIEVESEDDEFISVGDRLILNQVFFYNNTYAFKPGATQELDQLVDFLSMNPTVEVEIQGHTANNTDDIRPDPNFKGQGKEWNFKGTALKLSERRAEAVMEYLIEKGISKKRLIAAGYGDSQKRIPDAKTFEEFEKNMRVEAVVTKQ
jgi:outer membrane protein OmpA-like peptidoglycan-associated protein